MYDGEDLESYAHWLPEVRPGALIRHPAVPLVWRETDVEGRGEKGEDGGGGSQREGINAKARVFEMSRLEQPVYM